jgi:hypothetical protein
MKILVIGNFGTGWDGSVCDEKHIAEELKNLGHEVTELQREDAVEVQNGDYAFILIAQWNGYGDHVCEKLRNLYKCPVVYWAFDYQWDSNEAWHFEMAKEADLFLSKEMDHRRDYEDMGANFRWLPQDFAPRFLWPPQEEPKPEKQIIFTGSYLPQAQFRTDVLKAIDEKYELDIFSVTPDQWKEQGLKNVNGPLMDEALSELYTKYKICLSVDWKVDAEGYWSDRNAQIMCCGGLVLFKYVPLSEIVFRDYVVYFDTIEDCLEKIDRILENNYIGKQYAGMAYAQDNLKAANRVMDMLEIVRFECLTS